LGRITDPELIDEARPLLRIVMAERPLTLQETNASLSIRENIERGESCTSEADLELDSQDASKTKVRNLCGLFVSIIDSRIYLIHQTAKEFLVQSNGITKAPNHVTGYQNTWKQSLTPAESNTILLTICIWYLFFTEFENYPPEVKVDDCFLIDLASTYEYVGQFSFLDYAASHLASHFRQAGNLNDQSLLKASLDFCDTTFTKFRT
jgi:ankyrin repeat domain-containing protein 50